MANGKSKTGQRARSLKLRVIENAPPDHPAPPLRFARLLDSLTSEQRKTYPMAAGLMDYFPDALAEVAHISWAGNEKHNPGEPLHHARGKSNDHADCCARHLQQRGGVDIVTINGVEHRIRHSVALAWRALALAQEELESEYGYELPRGATSA